MKQKIIFCMSGQIQENLKLFFMGGRVEWTRLKIDMGTLSIGLRVIFCTLLQNQEHSIFLG